MKPESLVEGLFGEDGLRILPPGTMNFVVEQGVSVNGLRRRCRAAFSSLAPGETLSVVMIIDAAGVAKAGRWLPLPFQLAAVTGAIIAEHGIVLGRYGVTPDLARPTVLYELRTPAQRYAQAFLLSRSRQNAFSRGIRKILSLWAGCDPAVGAVVLIGRKL